MRFTTFYVACTLFFLSAGVAAAVSGTIGFVQGNIWYSKDPFFAGNAVRVYSGVFNGGADDIIGTVEFYDNGNKIGASEFQAVGGGRLREVWVDWTAVAGAHTLTAKITKAFVTRAGKPNEPAQIISSESGQSARSVDVDTDSDNTGDVLDSDDDNDGVADADEVARGTNPLLKDTDGDGVSDKNDQKPTGQDSTTSNQSLSSGSLMDTTAGAVASVAQTVDTAADTFRAPLVAKKLELEQRIAELQRIEAEVTQTKAGQSINDATGGSTVLPTKPTSTPGDTMKRIGLQLYRGVVIAALFVLDHKIVLYLLLAFVLYKLIRFVFRRFFSRGF